MSRRHKGKSERYVKLRFWLLNSPAWQSLPPAARALYIEMVKRYNGYNNGRIVMGVRDAKKLIGVSKDTAHMALRASEWWLTEYDSDYPVQHATKEFMSRTEFKIRSEFRKRSKILGSSSPKDKDPSRTVSS